MSSYDCGETCVSIGHTFYPQYGFVSGAVISYICYGIIFYLYYVVQMPSLKRHPSKLLIYKCYFELAYVSQYFWLAFQPYGFFWNTTSDCSICQAQTHVAPLCFLTQFSLLGGELWFCVLSRDIHLTISNPFSSYQKQSRKFLAFVLIGATVTSLVLVLLGTETYGLSSDPMIWIQDNVNSNSPNIRKIMLFYLWMGLIYTYSFYVLWFARQRINSGLEVTLKARLASVHRTMTYTFGFTLFWTIVFLLQFLDFTSTLSSENEKYGRTVSSFVLASRGLWSVVILLVGNWDDFHTSLWGPVDQQQLAKSNNTIDSVVSPHLNELLRKEILHYTTQGIRIAIFEQQLDRECGKRALRNTSLPKLGLFNRRGSLGSMASSDQTFSFSFKEFNESIGGGSGSSSSSAQGSQNVAGNPLHQADRKSGKSVRRGNKDLLQSLTSNEHPGSQNSPKLESVEESEKDDDEDILAEKSMDNAPKEFRMSFHEHDVSFARKDKPVAIKEDISDEDSVREKMRKRWNAITNNARSVLAKAPRVNVDFAFRDYCPAMFRKIRLLSGIEDEEYIAAFTETARESFSGDGRSGAFLYFSKSDKFIVKTTGKAEMKKLFSILPSYYDYLTKNPKSLLTRFMSAHAIIMYGTTLYFVVMQNIFANIDISERFDLKGSWVDRNGNISGLTRTQRMEGETAPASGEGMRDREAMLGDKKFVPLFKDNDLQYRISLRPEAAVLLSLQIREDIIFLRSCNLIDYSLLIGVRRRKFEVVDSEMTANAENQQQSPAASSQDNPFQQDADGGIHAGVVEGPGTYYFGIIDMLEDWNWDKKLERFFKTYFRCFDKDGISAAPPIAYADRFWNRAVRDVFEYVEDVLDGDIDAIFKAPTGRGTMHTTSVATSQGVLSASSHGTLATSSTSSVVTPLGFEQKSNSSVDSSDIESGLPLTIMSDEYVLKQKETDRRFSVIPLDFDRGSEMKTGDKGRTSEMRRPSEMRRKSAYKRDLSSSPVSISSPKHSKSSRSGSRDVVKFDSKSDTDRK